MIKAQEHIRLRKDVYGLTGAQHVVCKKLCTGEVEVLGVVRAEARIYIGQSVRGKQTKGARGEPTEK